MLKAVVSAGYKFVDADPRETKDLVAIFDVNGDTRLGLVELAVEKLRERMSTDTDVETGVVSFSVTTRSPELSEALGQRIVELFNELNPERRQSQAAAERELVEGGRWPGPSRRSTPRRTAWRPSWSATGATRAPPS